MNFATLLLSVDAPAYHFPPILANAGTPLMWAGMFHLLFGNALIGLVEGLLIARVFRSGKRRAIFLMVAANYFSMSVGIFALKWGGASAMASWSEGNVDIYNAPKMIFVAVFACYFATIVLEWPFCWFSLGRSEHRLRRSILASALAQTFSYVALAIYYGLFSPVTLLTNATLDSTLSFVKTDAVVFYCSPSDGFIYSIRADGSERKRLWEMGETDRNARLVVRPEQEFSRWALWLQGDREVAHCVRPGFVTRNQVSAGAFKENPRGKGGTWMNFGAAIDLRADNVRAWKVSSGFWPGYGLYAENAGTGEVVGLAFETLLIAWAVRNVSVLPGDLVVFQLGTQIVIFDLKSRKIGLLAHGRGPVVLLAPEP